MLVLRAATLIQQSKPELAENELRQALSLDPHNDRAHALLGLCLIDRQQYAEATREAEAAVHLAPDGWFSHYVLAQVLFRRNREPDAKTAVQEAIRLHPEGSELWGLLAMIEYSMGHWADALAAAERGLQADPEDIRCANARSMALVKLGRQSEAHAALNATLSRDPDDAMSHANQGWALLEMGNIRGAQEHFREALRLEPNMGWAQQGMLTALKARNPLYRLMLGYFLWMSKLSPSVQWGLVLGLYFGIQVLQRAARANPALQPFVLPVVVAYGAFVVVSWLADPLFNLMLRLDRFGKHVLDGDERRGANLVGSCLLGAVICLVLGLVLGSFPLIMAALGCAVMAIPCSAVFRCDAGWPRRNMALGTAGLALVGGLALLTGLLDVPAAGTLGPLFFIGVFLSSFLANAMMTATVRH